MYWLIGHINLPHIFSMLLSHIPKKIDFVENFQSTRSCIVRYQINAMLIIPVERNYYERPHGQRFVDILIETKSLRWLRYCHHVLITLPLLFLYLLLFRETTAVQKWQLLHRGSSVLGIEARQHHSAIYLNTSEYHD